MWLEKYYHNTVSRVAPDNSGIQEWNACIAMRNGGHCKFGNRIYNDDIVHIIESFVMSGSINRGSN